MSSPVRNSHLRIDFVVREVSPDGSVPDDELRAVKFGDDLPHGDAFDFFNRCRDAINLMFKQGHGAQQVLSFASVGPNKINVIKVVRELTQLGLKEAKDIVEGPPGTAFVAVPVQEDVVHALKMLTDAGASPRARPKGGSDLLLREYRRLPL